jgi:repressor LexA
MPLPPAQQRTWKAILERARRDGRIPEPATLAEAFGLHLTTIIQHLRALETKGLLEIESRGVGRSPVIRFTPHGRALAGLNGLPVLGSIPAGPLSEAIQRPIGFLSGFSRPGWFGLRVNGDSMADEIKDGDIVILQSRAKPNPGEVCAVRVGHEEASLKSLRWRGNEAQLIPNNPRYPTIKVPLRRVQVDGVYRGLLRGEIAHLWLEDAM